MTQPNTLYDPNEVCDCETCKDSEKPCSFDCDKEDACQGCRESREEREEVQFEIDCQKGRI